MSDGFLVAQNTDVNNERYWLNCSYARNKNINLINAILQQNWRSETNEKEIITINIMLTVFMENKCNIQLVVMFKYLINNEKETKKLNAISFITIIELCTQETVYHFGKFIHSYSVKNNKNILNHINPNKFNLF